MKIDKVINNNVVSALDEQGKELVIMGRGSAFQKKAGQRLDEKRIEKIFRLESPDDLKHFKELFLFQIFSIRKFLCGSIR